jgi:hypothetical protein
MPLSSQETVAKTAQLLQRSGLAKTQDEAAKKVVDALRRQDRINSEKR